MADATKDLVIKLSLENEQLKKEMDKTNQKFNEGKKQSSGLLGGLKKLKAGYIAIAGVLAGTVVAALNKLKKIASDAQETFSKFDVVFKSVQKSADKVTKNLVKNFGLSTVAAKELLSASGDLLQGFGFTQRKSLELSDSMIQLATDVASFKNVAGGTKEVLASFNAALVGERERLKTLGIAILETDIKQRALEKGLKLVNGQVDRQNKALITAELIQEKAKNSVGDFARTQSNLANAQRVLASRIEDVAVKIGTFLLPAATKTVNVITKIINKISEFRGFVRTFLIIRGAIDFAIIAPLKSVIAGVTGAIKAFGELGKTAINAFRAIKDFDIKELFSSIAEGLTNTAKITVETTNKITLAWANVFIDIAKGWNETEKELVDGLENVGDATDAAGRKFKKLTEKDIAALKSGLFEATKEITGLLSQGFQQASDNRLQQIESDRQAALDGAAMASEELKALEEEEAARREEQFNNDVESFERAGNTKASHEIKLQKEREKADEERQRREDELNRQFDAKRRQEQTKAFKRNKAAAIIEAGINTALGITSALKLTPPVSFIMAAIQGAIGAAQTAIIASQPIPQFAQGGIIQGLPGNAPGAEDGIIAAQNGESVLNKEATAILGRDAIDQLNAGRSVSPTVNITVNGGDTNEVVETMNDYFRQFGGARTLGVG
jgi:hypothetical protein